MIESLVSYTGHYVRYRSNNSMELRYQYKQSVRITIKNFEENTCIMIDVTVPTYKNISLKEFQKLSKYKDLEIEVTKMWKLKTKTIPIVIGVLGMIKKGAQNFIDQVPGKASLQEMQKTVLTSTTHILPKVLSM